jgi:putative transposase
VLAEYVEHYNGHCPHRFLSRHAPSNVDATVVPIGDADHAQLRRTDVLDGLIHEYRLVA